MGYFGTDGVRGKAELFFENDFAMKLAQALSLKNPRWVTIASDTRVSGEAIKKLLIKGFLESGVNVIDLGIVPTPCLALMTKRYADYGVMVSASHNPPEYNGIKIISNQGYKISEQEEEEISSLVGQKRDAGRANYIRKDVSEEYFSFIADKTGALPPIDVTLDVCHGATALFAKSFFNRLGARAQVVNEDTDGSKINVACGSTNIASLRFQTPIALAFDGDGDRMLAKTRQGTCLSGDDILFILARYFRCQKPIVGTVLTNMGLEKALQRDGMTLERTAVGDKYVQRRLVENQGQLGGEKSGHIIIGDSELMTGDGLLAGALLLKAIDQTGVDPDDLQYRQFPQIEYDILCDAPDRSKLCESEALLQAMKFYGDCQIVLRPSGTEPKIRIMVQGENESRVKEAFEYFKKGILEQIKKM